MPTPSPLPMDTVPLAKQVRHLSHQVLRAQEEERTRISRELHDVVAQTLVGIHLHLRALSHDTTADPRRLRRRIARTQRLVEESVNVVHKFARELRPAALDDLGLIPALRAYLREVADQSAIEICFEAPAEIEELPAATRTTLFRIAQEALANVVKHANATKVKVALEKLRHGVQMEITDDGRGFTPPAAGFGRTNQRLGLLGMRERAEMMAGTVSIDSRPGRGTAVRVELPA